MLTKKWAHVAYLPKSSKYTANGPKLVAIYETFISRLPTPFFTCENIICTLCWCYDSRHLFSLLGASQGSTRTMYTNKNRRIILVIKQDNWNFSHPSFMNACFEEPLLKQIRIIDDNYMTYNE